jgi:hypothetical protein
MVNLIFPKNWTTNKVMPALERELTIYTPNGSRSWSGDLAQIEKDRSEMSCKVCEEPVRAEITPLKPIIRGEIILPQIQVQAASKT